MNAYSIAPLEHEIRSKEEETSMKLLPPVQDTLHGYLMKIRNNPLLTLEKENSLAKRYRETGDSDAAWSIVTSHLRLVVKIALEYQRKWVFDLMDLIQEGNIGLIQAVKRFDPFRGVRFSHYAAFWIKAYILKFIIDNWRLIRIGTSQTERKLFYNLQKEKNYLEKMGFYPGHARLAAILDTDKEKIIEMEQRITCSEISLDAPLGATCREPRSDFISTDTHMLDDVIADDEFIRSVRQQLEIFKQSLDAREQAILEKRILSDSPATLKSIGASFGITKERARQIEAKLKESIKRYLKKTHSEFSYTTLPALRQNASIRTRYIN